MIRAPLIVLVVVCAVLAVGAAGAGGVMMTSPTLSLGWHLIGLPALPAPADPYTVFGPVPINYRLFGWDAGMLRYVVVDPLQPDLLPAVVSGEGYWLDIETVSGFSYFGVPWPAGTVAPIPLGPAGWHMIGDPHEVSVPLEHCMIEHPGGEVTVADAAAAGWISLPIYGWDPVLLRYWTVGIEGPPTEDDTALSPWRGYWLNTEVDDLRLMVQQPLGEGAFDAWLVGNEGIQQDYVLDLSKESLLHVIAAAPIYATAVTAVTTGPTDLVPDNTLALRRAAWWLQMPFGEGFQVLDEADGDYTIQVQATTEAGTRESVVITLHVIGVEPPPTS